MTAATTALETIATATGFAKAATIDIMAAIDEYLDAGGTLDDTDADLATALEVLAVRPYAQEWLAEHGLANA